MPTLIKRREQQTGWKRSKVTWQVQFPTGLLKEDGKPEYIYKTLEKEAEAKAHLRTLKGEEEDGGVVKAATMPLAEFLNDHWLHQSTLRSRSALPTAIARWLACTSYRSSAATVSATSPPP